MKRGLYTKIFFVLSFFLLPFVVSSQTDTVYTWTEQSGPPTTVFGDGDAWRTIASSADGMKLVVGGSLSQIFISTDRGVTWTGHGPIGDSFSITSSADGTKLASASSRGQINISTDGGTTWSAHGPSTDWRAIASSADGTKLAAGNIVPNNRGHIYTSTDSGFTWTDRTTFPADVLSIASSADGTKLAATSNFALYGNDRSGRIYTSIDSGITWTESFSGGISPLPTAFSSIASSANGTKLVATGFYGQIFTSSDSGATWAGHGPTLNWRSITSSSDGTKLAAIGYDASSSYIYLSSDSGLTWTLSGPAIEWRDIASSADGTKLAATRYRGHVYTYPSLIVFPTINLAVNSCNSSSANAVFYRQAGLFEHNVRITNNTSVTIPAVRLILETLTAGSSLYNQMGTDSNGKQFLQYNQPLSPGQSVTLRARYYNPSRTPTPSASYSVLAVNSLPEPSLPAGALQIPIESVEFLPYGFNYIQWIEDASHRMTENNLAVQYRNNSGDAWHTAYGLGSSAALSIGDGYDYSAPGSSRQVLDYGPPEFSSPASVSRMYRLFLFPKGTSPVPAPTSILPISQGVCAPSLVATLGTCSAGATIKPINLSWTAPNDTNYIGFNIYRSGTTLPIASIPISAGTTYSDTPPSAGTSYTYSVAAAYVGSESPAIVAAPITSASCTSTASLSADPDPCTIPKNASSCTTTLSWNVTDPTVVGGTTVTSSYPSANTSISTSSDSGTKSNLTIPHAGRTFFLNNGGASPLAQLKVNSVCAEGTVWDSASGRCKQGNTNGVWSAWGPCIGACGSVGTQTRTCSIDNTSTASAIAAAGGCVGPSSQSCSTAPCGAAGACSFPANHNNPCSTGTLLTPPGVNSGPNKWTWTCGGTDPVVTTDDATCSENKPTIFVEPE